MRRVVCCDAVAGEAMIKEAVEAAGKVEMETFKKHGMYEKAPIEERWGETGESSGVDTI